MAKTKEEKMAIAAEQAEQEVKEVKEVKESGPSYDELLSLVKSLASEIDSLKKGNTSSSNSNNSMAELVNLLGNRKTDREVTIVHNQELNGGLTTHLELSNISIDFRLMGEQRVLSWQQFEECVSKYRSFFDRKIILLGEEEGELAERYNVPYLHKEGATALTKSKIDKLPTLSVRELEDLITSLSDEDQTTVFSLWLGKCYTKEAGYYDRHKIDTLNRLSNGAFDNFLLVMNGDNQAENK